MFLSRGLGVSKYHKNTYYLPSIIYHLPSILYYIPGVGGLGLLGSDRIGLLGFRFLGSWRPDIRNRTVGS